MGSDNIEIWEPNRDRLLIYKKGYTLGLIEDVIEKEKLNGLRIWDHYLDYNIESLNFLIGATKIKRLLIQIYCPCDVSAIYKMNNVRNLSLQACKRILQLNELPYVSVLEELSTDDTTKLSGLSACTSLKSLSVPNIGDHISELLQLKMLE